MEEEKREAPSVHPSRVKLAEYERQEWVVDAPEGTTDRDLENPAFWAHIAAKFIPYARLEIRAHDGSWIGEAIVLSCGRTWAKVAVLNMYQLFKENESLDVPVDHEVKWRGPGKKHTVERISDGAVLVEGIQTKIEALEWLHNHERKLAA